MWPDNLLLENGSDLLLEAGGLLLLEFQPDRPGGNLVKPHNHLGNAPGRKPKSGARELAYRLTRIGRGTIVTPIAVGLPVVTGRGEMAGMCHRHFARRLTSAGSITHRHRIHAVPTRSYIGTASEDLGELLLLDILLRENS